MHLFGIGTVIVNGIRRNSLTEIRLKTVNTHVEENFKLVLKPFPGFGIGKINNRHAGLPHIPLPHLTVGTSEKIPLFHAFPEENGLLTDIRINPNTDVQPFVLDAFEHSDRVREYPVIPQKVAPMEFLHPETVKMERPQRNSPLEHAVDEAHDGFLVIVCRKRGGKPQPECPRCRKSRLACDVCITS